MFTRRARITRSSNSRASLFPCAMNAEDISPRRNTEKIDHLRTSSLTCLVYDRLRRHRHRHRLNKHLLERMSDSLIILLFIFDVVEFAELAAETLPSKWKFFWTDHDHITDASWHRIESIFNGHHWLDDLLIEFPNLYIQIGSSQNKTTDCSF